MTANEGTASGRRIFTGGRAVIALRSVAFSLLMTLSTASVAASETTPSSGGAVAGQEANLQVIRTLYDAFGRGDVDGIVGLMDEGVIWQVPGPAVVPFAGTWKGHAGVRQFFDHAISTLDVLDQKLTGFLADADRVGAIGQERMRVKATGKEYVTNWVHLYTIVGGKIVAFEEFVDTAAQAEAFTPSADADP
jgi:ketosteroid isomerase-like protein